MNSDQDSEDILENEILMEKKFAPRQVDIPFLLNNMVKIDKFRLAKHIKQNDTLYRKCGESKHVAKKNAVLEKTCAKVTWAPPLKLPRSLEPSHDWKLAPNRYSIKGQDLADIVKRQTGRKGPFFSNTLRNDNSLYGHLATPKPCGIHTFYEIPSMVDLQNRYYNKRKTKFPAARREQKPYLRFMVDDLVLCWRNPKDPGPAHYFPKNHCVENNVSKPVKVKPITITNFLPNSSVPAQEPSFLKVIDKSTPGPGRYETIEIACPCQKKLIREPHIWREIEIEKRKSFRHLKCKHIKEELYCPCTKIRNIRGHGHTSVFKSKTFRLTEKIAFTKKADRLEKQHHTAKYIQMIVNPPRIPISITRVDMTPKPVHLTFNSIIKPKMRCKLKVNKRIAFLSTSPRFKYDDKMEIVPEQGKGKETKRIRDKVTAKTKNIEPHIMTPIEQGVFKRLQKLPPRVQQKQIAVHEKVFTFSPIPPPQLLLKDSEILTRPPDASYYQSTYNIENFIKDEYKKSSHALKSMSNEFPREGIIE